MNDYQANLNITQIGTAFNYLAWGVAILMIIVVVSTAKGR